MVDDKMFPVHLSSFLLHRRHLTAVYVSSLERNNISAFWRNNISALAANPTKLFPPRSLFPAENFSYDKELRPTMELRRGTIALHYIKENLLGLSY